MAEEIEIYTDGGSRGNPGPSASAWVLLQKNKVTHQGSKFLGTATNNQAEYQGVLIALEWLLKNKKIFKNIKKITFYLDSELVVKQLSGKYKIKNAKLKYFASEIIKLQKSLSLDFYYKAIAREKNFLADSLVNETLDQKISS